MALLPLHRRTRRTDDLHTVPLHVGDECRYVGRSLGRRQRQRPGGLAEPGVPEVLSVPRLLGESFRALDGQLHEGMVAVGFGDVRPAHYAVFRFLKLGGSRVAELAEEARMTKQSMGELVAHLERRGYVERLPDPQDGRARIVVWTEAGQRWTEAEAERLGEIEDALAERLGGQERLEELAGSLEGLMALVAEPIPTRAGSAHNSVRTF